MREQFTKTGLATEIGSKRQRVNEETDQLLELYPLAICDRTADDDVVLACVSMKQCLKRCQQGHEQSRAMTVTQAIELVSQLGGKRKRDAAAAIAELCWTLVIGG